jgi:hypothetical protein
MRSDWVSAYIYKVIQKKIRGTRASKWEASVLFGQHVWCLLVMKDHRSQWHLKKHDVLFTVSLFPPPLSFLSPYLDFYVSSSKDQLWHPVCIYINFGNNSCNCSFFCFWCFFNFIYFLISSLVILFHLIFLCNLVLILLIAILFFYHFLVLFIFSISSSSFNFFYPILVLVLFIVIFYPFINLF